MVFHIPYIKFFTLMFLLLFLEVESVYNNKLLNKNNNGFSIKLRKIKSDSNARLNFLSLIQKTLGEKYIKRYVISAGDTDITDPKTKVIPLKNFKNSQYVGNIYIGEPKQELPVIFDTGSGNLWVTSSKCKSLPCKNHKAYNRVLSSKFKLFGYGVEVTFGTGTVAGEINQDVFTLGNIVIPEQKFAEIMYEKGDVFNDSKFSGILGLGYPTMAAYNIKPAFDSIISQKLLKNNLISFYYSYNEEKDGEVGFGYINKSLYEGDIKYYPVIDKYYWTIELKDILYNGKSLGFCPDGCKAIIDSGTSLLAGPTKDVRKLLNSLPVESDCSNYNEDDKLEFVFNSDSIDNTKEETKYTLNIDEYVSKSNEKNGKSKCAALIMPLDVPSPHGPAWVFGETFMQKYYTIFDRDNDQIGFAIAKHSETKKTYD